MSREGLPRARSGELGLEQVGQLDKFRNGRAVVRVAGVTEVASPVELCGRIAQVVGGFQIAVSYVMAPMVSVDCGRHTHIRHDRPDR